MAHAPRRAEGLALGRRNGILFGNQYGHAQRVRIRFLNARFNAPPQRLQATT
jgi:hypothetical protein